MSLSSPAIPEAAVRPRAVRAGAMSLALLCAGHFFVDLYSAALAALQPLLVERFHLSLAQAGLAAGLMLVSSSLAQPVYGILSDRLHTQMFTVLAPAVAGVFLSSLGLAGGYGWMVLMAVLGGAGVASFHPQASSLAIRGVESSRGRWMAIFISSGTLGVACGPLVYSFLSTRAGLENTYWAAAPGVLASLLLFLFLPPAPAPAATSPSTPAAWTDLHAVRKPLAILYGAVLVRSIVQTTYAQLLPLYLTRERGFSFTESNLVLSAYLAAGALGGFAGGWLADQLGGKRVILISMLGSLPPLALFFLAGGWLSLAGLLVGGLVLLFTIPVNVVMAQDLAPRQVGTVSALMMGFAWGVAGMIFVPLAGWAADAYSLHAALFSLLVFPFAGFFLTRMLPE